MRIPDIDVNADFVIGGSIVNIKCRLEFLGEIRVRDVNINVGRAPSVRENVEQVHEKTTVNGDHRE